MDSAPIAFVLGGGGYLGGYQVGMLRALLERDIKPDLVLGTSVGSIQGAMIAREPALSTVDQLSDFWLDTVNKGVMKVRLRGLLANAARLRPAVASQDTLRALLEENFGQSPRIEDLAIPFQAVAASIERASVRYFDSGPLIPALLASAAVPGLWPPVRIGDEHFVDGGVAETIAVGRAVSQGAKTVYVMRLRQREVPLKAPRWPWQLGQVVYEVSRRHRLNQVINTRPDGVTIHLMPTGEEFLEPPDNGLHTSVSEQLDTIHRRISQGYTSSAEYLDNPRRRRVAQVRAKARLEPTDEHAYADVEVSPFVSEKLHRHYELFDHDGNGILTAEDFLATADRIAGAFGRPSDELRETYGKYWEAIRGAAGLTSAEQLGHGDFDRAMARLAGNQAAYDTYLLPVVAALLDAADVDRDGILGPREIQGLLMALHVPADEAQYVARRLDTNGDGVVGIDELDEAFRDYFTSDEPNCVGNSLFGAPPRTPTQSAALA